MSILAQSRFNLSCIAYKAKFSDYMSFFGSEARFKYIRYGIYPPKSKSRIAPKDKWLTFLDMSHVIATFYNKVVAELPRHKMEFLIPFFFFQIWGHLPHNPSSHKMYTGYIFRQLVHVYMKDGCSLFPTCMKWKQYKKRMKLIHGRINLWRDKICLKKS